MNHIKIEPGKIQDNVWVVQDPALARPNEDIFALDPASEPDNIRIYVPMDLNGISLLSDLYALQDRYSVVSESSEGDFISTLASVLRRLDVYDQAHMQLGEKVLDNGHSRKATNIVREILKWMVSTEGTADTFPYEAANELCVEYQLDNPFEI